jgi:NitT/TauT family transport system substrate-binding protein
MERRAFLGTVVAGCVRAAEAELRVAVNQTTIESAPLFLNPVAGVRVIPVPNGRAASAQLVSGMVDAATGSETQVLLNSVTQPDLRIVLTLAECRYRMVARRSAGIRRVADLRGKRVATTLNTSAQYFLAEMLRTAQLREADTQVAGLEGPAMPGALAKHEVDAIAMLGGDALVLENRSVYFERFNLNTTSTVLRDPGKRRLLVKLVRAARGVSLERPDQVAALSKAIATLERIIASVRGQFRFPAELDAGSLQPVLEAMELWAAGIANRTPRRRESLAGLLDSAVWREAEEGR